MSNNNLDIHDEFNIQDNIKKNFTIYYHNSIKYYTANEILTSLGFSIKHFGRTLKDVSEENKIYFKDLTGDKVPKLNRKAKLINTEGVNEILTKTSKKISEDKLKELSKYNFIQKDKGPSLKECMDNKPNELSFFSGKKITTEKGELYIPIYFIGYEIATLLDYKNPMNTIKNNVSRNNKILFKNFDGDKHVNINPNAYLINQNGACELITRTRKLITPDVRKLLDDFNIIQLNKEYKTKIFTKEQLTLSSIVNILKIYNPKDQYVIGDYRLDLFIPKYNIVIECDENGHSGYNPNDEKKRVDFINSELGITSENWIRYNPDENNFDIEKVVRIIIARIDCIKRELDYNFKNKYEELVKNYVSNNIIHLKKCIMCHEDKDIINCYKYMGCNFSKKCNDCLKIYECMVNINKYDIDKFTQNKYSKEEKDNMVRKLNNFNISQIYSVCKKLNIIQHGSRDTLITNISYFIYNCKKIEELIVNYEGMNESLIDDSKEILDNLENTTYDNLRKICSKYKIKQRGRASVLRERIILYFTKNIKLSERRRNVYKYDNNGNFLKEYNTIVEASKDNDILPSNIARAMNNKVLLNGFIWYDMYSKFSEDEIVNINKNKQVVKKRIVYSKDDIEGMVKMKNSGSSFIEIHDKYKISSTHLHRMLNNSFKENVDVN